MESYFGSHKEDIFANVSTLIYVFDLNSANEEQDYEDYVKCVEYLKECSRNAQVFVLFHKFDLIPLDQRDRLVEYKRQHVQKISNGAFEIVAFGTSIFTDSLYKAWSRIVYTLIPNSEALKEHLQQFTDTCEAEEVILFEKDTLLDVAHASNSSSTKFIFKDANRFEKVSNAVKIFKGSLAFGKSMRSLDVHNSEFDTFLYEFTSTTFIMVVVADKDVRTAATLMNINLARPHFERLLRPK